MPNGVGLRKLQAQRGLALVFLGHEQAVAYEYLLETRSRRDRSGKEPVLLLSHGSQISGD